MHPMRIKLIINPTAGRQSIRQTASDILGHLLDSKSILRVDQYYTQKAGDAIYFAQNTDSRDYDLLIAAGGDGTVNETVNGMLRGGIDLPLAILPAGTVNDFANYLDIPTEPFSYANMIRDFHTRKTDVGKAGDRYFLNVAAGGLLSDLGYKVPSDAKTAMGRFAYFLEGARDIPGNLYQSIPLTLSAEEKEYSGDAFLFLITNSTSVGGFRKIAPYADSSDGLLDVLIISKLAFGNFFPLMGRLFVGDLINDEKITYFQTKKLTLTTSSPDIRLDLDGEEDGLLPIEISCVHEAIRLVVPK